MSLKHQDPLLERYGCSWDQFAPALYRFACFLTHDREQATLYLEQVFIGCWRNGKIRRVLGRHGKENALRLMFYRDVWRRYSGFSGRDVRELAELYLIHVQHFPPSEARKILRK